MVIKKKINKKWYFLKFFKVKNLIQIYTKTHQIAPFIKIFSGGGGGGHAPEPPRKAHGMGPPKSWGRPCCMYIL